MASENPISRSILLKSNPSVVEDACREILDELQKRDYPQEKIFAVHLAFEEAFVNAVKHGNKMDSSKQIKIEYAVDEQKVEIYMSDEGSGFDPDSVPDPRCGENLYKPDGRGLFLIHSYMDVVKYNETGNQIRMIKYKGNG